MIDNKDANKDKKFLKNFDYLNFFIIIRIKHEHIILLQQLFDVGYDLCIVEMEITKIYHVLFMMMPWITMMERYVKDGVISKSMSGVAMYYRCDDSDDDDDNDDRDDVDDDDSEIEDGDDDDDDYGDDDSKIMIIMK